MKSVLDLHREHLVRALERLDPYDAVEAGHRRTTLDWLSTTKGNPFDRREYSPGHVTGSALVMAAEHEQVLLIHHGKIGRWLQPGGHAEPHEYSPLDTAIREVVEETGVAIGGEAHLLFDIDVHQIAARRTEPAHYHFDFRFLFTVDLVPLLASSDATSARWVSLGELERFCDDEGIRRMSIKAKALRAAK